MALADVIPARILLKGGYLPLGFSHLVQGSTSARGMEAEDVFQFYEALKQTFP
ncbi:MAG: hypothetical protein CM15mP49_02110 [Actinomycetota bacterium]|nr:MAG: hypothetical protein CM15mP49_02110 [Actinomycetota bacterium]